MAVDVGIVVVILIYFCCCGYAGCVGVFCIYFPFTNLKDSPAWIYRYGHPGKCNTVTNCSCFTLEAILLKLFRINQNHFIEEKLS